MHVGGKFTFDCCLAGWALLNLCINTFNDFFKNNVSATSEACRFFQGESP